MTDEERKTNQERDSFVKTSVVAFAANYLALNRQVPVDEVIDRSVNAASKLWDALQEWRAKQ